MAELNFQRTLAAMRKFVSTSRGKSQAEILKAFHHLVLHAGHFSESGSILTNDLESGKLRLFNPDQFLTKYGYLKPGEPWQTEFHYDEGIAGESFKYHRTVRVADVTRDDRFSVVEGQVPITSMICVPIMLNERSPPFGIASFHNNDPSKAFSDEDESIAESYVEVLDLALSASNEKYDSRRTKQRRVFIGCATEDLRAAQLIQNQLRRSALVQIWNQGVFKSGGYVLELLLNKVKEYDCAIFLLTPRDVIEHRGVSYLVARDNVIFEAGIFFSQLGRERTFLIVPEIRELKLPSDMNGLIPLGYVPPADDSDLGSALAPACNEIIEFLDKPLPPIT